MCIKGTDKLFVPEILPNKSGVPKHIEETVGKKDGLHIQTPNSKKH